jgi:hypothetical protein
MSDAAERQPTNVGQHTVDPELEFAFRVAEAIKRLAEEQSQLRKQASSQNHELVALRSRNDELWRHLVLMRHSYRRVIDQFVIQLQHIDGAIDVLIPREIQNSTGFDADQSYRPENPTPL